MVSGAIVTNLYGNNGDPMRYTVASLTGITQGDLWRFVDPITASGANFAAQGDSAAGVAAYDKDAADGATSHSFLTNCDIEVVASGAIVKGAPIVFVADNYIRSANTTVSGAAIAGFAKETASDSERITARIRI